MALSENEFDTPGLEQRTAKFFARLLPWGSSRNCPVYRWFRIC